MSKLKVILKKKRRVMKYRANWMNMIVWANVLIIGVAFWYGVYKLVIYLFEGI